MDSVEQLLSLHCLRRCQGTHTCQARSLSDDVRMMMMMMIMVMMAQIIVVKKNDD